MKRPPLLSPGDAVRVVAPSGVFDREKLAAGLVILEQIGLKPIVRPDIFARERYLAGTDARRAEELRQAIADEQAKAIWVARGGYGVTRILAGIDTDKIERAPKWLIGFSDDTALHCLWARVGLMSVHGAMVATLSTWSEAARAQLFALLFKGGEQRYEVRAAGGTAKSARGVLVGGNLTMLGALAGTGYLPSWRNRIVFLEDLNERPYRLDRTLTQLKQAGAFAGVRGIVIGQLSQCDDPDAEPKEPGALAAVLDVLAPLGVPIAAGLEVGHEPSSRAILLGGRAELDLQKGSLVVTG